MQKELLNTIIHFLEEKKAEDIVLLDLRSHGAFVDYMIVASCTSSRHVTTLAEYILQELKKNGISVYAEGVSNGEWALLDCYHVIVHLFKPDVRSYYKLEKIWDQSFSQENHEAQENKT